MSHARIGAAARRCRSSRRRRSGELPSARAADADGIVGIGADLEPGTLLAAYRSGLPDADRPGDGMVVARPAGDHPARRPAGEPLAAAVVRPLEVRFDTGFATVVDACADRRRPHGWINRDIAAAYTRLHELGWVHSVEAWSLDDGTWPAGSTASP